MAHKLWCGKECWDCSNECAVSQNFPCSLDCENLLPDGTRNVPACESSGCDAVIEVK